MNTQARTTRKADVSTARRQLVELLQTVRFGRVESLIVRGGEPVLAPAPRVLRTIVFGKDNAPHAMGAADDFALRREIVELFEFLDRERDVLIESLEVVDGLPRRMTVLTGARS